MKKLILLFFSIILFNGFVYCYSNPRNKLQKSKPLFIKQYEERNRKEELARRNKITKPKKEILPMKEVKIKFTEESFNYGKAK